MDEKLNEKIVEKVCDFFTGGNSVMSEEDFDNILLEVEKQKGGVKK